MMYHLLNRMLNMELLVDVYNKQSYAWNAWKDW